MRVTGARVSVDDLKMIADGNLQPRREGEAPGWAALRGERSDLRREIQDLNRKSAAIEDEIAVKHRRIIEINAIVGDDVA